MREQLIRYVDLLFAGAPNAGDIKQEILQNTLDRYDDLVAQGKQPEAAYSLAISGIGDINEILRSEPAVEPVITNHPNHQQTHKAATPIWKKLLRAAAIFLYIISPIPLFVLSELGLDTIGLCGTISIVAVATVLIVLAGSIKDQTSESSSQPTTPQNELRRAIKNIILAIGLVAYFILSFTTQAWFITWLVFPIMAATQGLVNACFDLKEAMQNEN